MYQFKPPVVDTRHMLWETYSEDIRTEWLGAKFRELGIPFDLEPVTVVDDSFRRPNVGNKLSPLPRLGTGRLRFYVPADVKDRAIEVLKTLLTG